MNYLITIFLAYILDLIIGDPQWQWHPVRLIGRSIALLEVKLNKDKFHKIISGIILVIIVAGSTIICVAGILKLAKFIHPLLYYIVSAALIYFCLSIKALCLEANKISRALINNHLQEARKGLSLIVGRDTQNLDRPEIIRATIETVAESIMDGIVAPLFYLFLGGPVLMWGYKAINTLDSMVGYRSSRFIDFGQASAKIDGIFNFIPGRITGLLIVISSLFLRKNLLNSLKCQARYFFKGIEFNSLLTEASMAGALGIRLGGVNFYNSIPVEMPFMGESHYPLETSQIRESLRIVYLSSFLFMALGLSFMYLAGRR